MPTLGELQAAEAAAFEALSAKVELLWAAVFPAPNDTPGGPVSKAEIEPPQEIKPQIKSVED